MNRRLNVLHVISDQHLASCMGVEGHPHANTPTWIALRVMAHAARGPTHRTLSALLAG